MKSLRPVVHPTLVGAMVLFAVVASAHAEIWDWPPFPDRPVTKPPFSALYAFGDSLSDSGNAYLLLDGQTAIEPYAPVPSAPYDSRRFTNGRTWVEFLAEALGLRGDAFPALRTKAFGNYAVGGAQADGGTSPDFGDQVSWFLDNVGDRAPSGALYVVQFGGNDIRTALELLQTQGPDAASAEIKAAIAAIVASMADLHGAGAEQFLVAKAPNIGRTPVVVTVLGEKAAEAAELLSEQYNAALVDAVESVAQAWGIDVYLVDFFSFVDAAVEMPDGFGFSSDEPPNPQPCLPVFDPSNQICEDADQRLFWDGLHPTRAAHRIVGHIAFNVLPANRDEQSDGISQDPADVFFRRSAARP